MEFIFGVILLVFGVSWIVLKINSNIKKAPTTRTDLFFKDKILSRRNDYTANKQSNEFIPYKIIENDNTLNLIVDDFEERKQKAHKDIEETLGKALPNDVLWRVLQELYLEYFLKNHKIFLNTAYQQGLLLQKERKYKDAISHYSYGLYYLMCFYNAKFNPHSHIIDYVENDTQVIEMAQQKFINKIQLCAKYDNLDKNEIKKCLSRLIEVSALSKMNFESYYNIVKLHTIQKKEIKDEIKELNTERINITKSGNNDIFKGWKFNATLQFRTPLEVLKHHNEKIFDNTTELPDYTKEGWEGIWLPITKSYRELGLDIDEIPEGGVSTDIGQLTVTESNNYVDFLIKFHTIAESKISVEQRITKIKELDKTDTNFHKYFKLFSNGNDYFLDNHFRLLIQNVLPSNISLVLKQAGYIKLTDLNGVNPNELLKLKGVGKSTIEKIKEYL